MKYTINGVIFEGPELPQGAVPVEVSPLQAKLALSLSGKLTQLETWIGTADITVRLAYDNATSWERKSLLLMSVALALQWTDQEINELFVQAHSILV